MSGTTSQRNYLIGMIDEKSREVDTANYEKTINCDMECR